MSKGLIHDNYQHFVLINWGRGLVYIAQTMQHHAIIHKLSLTCCHCEQQLMTVILALTALVSQANSHIHVRPRFQSVQVMIAMQLQGNIIIEHVKTLDKICNMSFCKYQFNVYWSLLNLMFVFLSTPVITSVLQYEPTPISNETSYLIRHDRYISIKALCMV